MKKLLLIFGKLIVLSLQESDPFARVIKGNTGEIGLNLLGFHVNVGLKPLIAPNGVGGTVHAQAGTPFGQYAAAGAQGKVGITQASGNVYAQATAGQSIATAAVGAEGIVDPQVGPVGSMYAKAYNGDDGRGIILGNSDETLTNTYDVIRNTGEESRNKITSKDVPPKVDIPGFGLTKTLQNLSLWVGNSSIVLFFQQWMNNQSFIDDKSRSKFSKSDVIIIENDLQSSIIRNGGNLHEDDVSKNPNTKINYDKLINTSEETSSPGVLSFFRQWLQNKTIIDDNSRSKFVESKELLATQISN